MKFLEYLKNILRISYKQTVIRICFLCIFIIGVSSCEEPMTGRLEYKAPFAGIVASDEPNAALIGRKILKQGGNAADAAIATAFSMTVTIPSRVSLSGGGICQYYNQPEKKVYTIDFVPEIKEGKMVAPAFVRGMYALYAKGKGNYKWGSLVVPAEQQARFGHKISRAFASDIDDLSDAEMEKLGFSKNITEGSNISNLELASTLSKVRINAGRMYSGDVAKDFIRETTKNGMTITYNDINSYAPSIYEAEKVSFLNESVFYPKNSEFKGLWNGQGKTKTESNENLKTANFVIADRQGSVAACSLSMGANFGLKERLDNLGLIVASDMSGIKSSMSPLIVVNEHVNESRLAVSGTKTEKLIALIKSNIEQEKSSLEQWKESGFHCALGIPPYPESCKAYAGNDEKGYSYIVDTE